MKDYRLNTDSLGFLIGKLGECIASGKEWRVSVVEWREKRSLPQN